MKLILKYLIYNLKQNKFRTCLIIVFLILCNFLIVANLGINDYYELAYEQNIQYERGNVDLIVTPKETSELFDEGELDLPDNKIESHFEVFAVIGKTSIEKDKYIKVNIIGADLDDVRKAEIVHGIDKNSNGKKYVIISEATQELINKNKNDKMKIDILDKTYEYKVTDIADKSGLFSGDGNNIINILMNIEDVQEAFYCDGKINADYICLKDSNEVSEVKSDIKENNKNVKVEESYDKDSYNQKKQATSLALIVAMIIMFFISSYLIAFISKVIFWERMQAMGTFQSIGGSSFKTSGIMLAENMCYGVIGWLCGSVVAYFVCPYVFGVLNTFQTDQKIKMNISLSYYIIALLCTVALIFLCSLSSIRKMKKKNVKELLFAVSKDSKSVTWTTVVGGLLCFGGAAVSYVMNSQYNLLLGVLTFVLTIAGSIIMCQIVSIMLTGIYNKSFGLIRKRAFYFGANNIKRDKMLSSNVTLITIIVSLLMCIIMVILSVKGSMTTMIECNDFDISCTSLESDRTVYDDIKEVDGIKDTYYDYIAFSKAKLEDDVKVSVSVLGVADEKAFYNFRSQSISYDRDEAKELEDGRYALVDTFWADKNGLKLGDTFKLYDDDTDKELGKEYEITGFINSSGFVTTRDAIMIGQKYFDDDLNLDPYQYLMKIEKDADVDKVAREVAQDLVETSTVVNTIDEVVENSMSGVDMLIMILYVIIGISALLILFGVINNITVSFLNRKREIAVLYSTAMSRRQLIIMFYGEIFMMYLITVVYAAILSLVYKIIIPKVLWSAGLAFNIEYPVNAGLATIAILFIVLNLLVLIPVGYLYRMKTVDVLKYE